MSRQEVTVLLLVIAEQRKLDHYRQIANPSVERLCFRTL